MAADPAWVSTLLSGYNAIRDGNDTPLSARKTLRFKGALTVRDVDGVTEVEVASDTFADTIDSIASEVGAYQGQVKQGMGRFAADDGGGGVLYWDENETAAHDGIVYFQVGSSAGRWVRHHDGVYNPQWAGCKIDGTTDDAEAFISICGNNRVVRIPSGTMLIRKQANHFILLQNLDNLVIIGDGVTIKAADGESVEDDACGIFLSQCSNVTMVGFTIDGNRDERTPDEIDGADSSLIRIYGCSNLTFIGVKCKNSTFDGVYARASNPADISTYPTDLSFIDCEMDNSFRNGMSFAGARRVWIKGGYFHGSNGVNPSAGIDFEPNAGGSPDLHGCSDIYIEGARFEDNEGKGIVFAGGDANTKTKRVTCVGIACRNNGKGAMSVSYAEGIDIRGLSIIDDTAVVTERGYVDITSVASDVHISGLVARNVTGAAASKAILYCDNGALNGYTFSDLSFKNCTPYAMHILNPATIRGVDIDNCGGTYGAGATFAAIIQGANSVVEGFSARNCGVQALRLNGTMQSASNIRIHDCGPALLSSGASTGDGPAMRVLASCMLSNVQITRTGDAAEYHALYFDAAPYSLTGVFVRATGTNWTNATAVRVPADMSPCSMWRDVNLSPLKATKLAYNPGSIAAGESTSTTVAATKTVLRFKVGVPAHSISLGGCTSHAYVSAANTYTIVITNPTAGAIDLDEHEIDVEGYI